MDCIDRFCMKIEAENKGDLLCNRYNKVVVPPKKEKIVLSVDEQYNKALMDFRMGFIR